MKRQWRAGIMVLAVLLGIAVVVFFFWPNLPPDQDLQTDLPSAHGYLAVADLEKFVPGRPKEDILNDLKWRAGYVNAGSCEGRRVMAITYALLADPKDIHLHETYLAIFVNDKFEKFIRWLPYEMVEVPYEGTFASRPKPTRVDDCSWLIKAMKSPEVSIDELRKETKSFTAPPEQANVGLTIVWLLLRPGLRLRDATVNDFKKNAELRDQFNAARLFIGMTPMEVEHVFKAKPLETGEFEAGTCNLYGSNQAFPMGLELHFKNVVVLFQNEKATKIFTVLAGEWGRSEMPKGVIEFLKGQDATAKVSGDKKVPENSGQRR